MVMTMVTTMVTMNSYPISGLDHIIPMATTILWLLEPGAFEFSRLGDFPATFSNETKR